MFNKIKNFFNRSKKAIDNKCNEIYCKAQTAVANAKAEFYIDKTVGIIICVVVDVLLMGIVYAFIKNNIQTRLDTEIGNLWAYAALGRQTRFPGGVRATT